MVLTHMVCGIVVSSAMEIGQVLARHVASTVDILVVEGRAASVDAASQSAESVAAALRDLSISVSIHHATGQMAQAVVEHAQTASYDLVVVGSRGRSGIVRLVLGSVAHEVAAHVPTSLLVVKGRSRDFKKLLVCTAAGPSSDQPVRFAGQLAEPMSLSVTLLHVMSQLALRMSFSIDEAEAPEPLPDAPEKQGWQEGQHLRAMLKLLNNQSVHARAIVRQGLVLDEIIAEAKEGHHDVIVVGAHITPGVRSFLVEDFAKNVLLAADRPVLIVRQVEEG